MQRTRRLRRTPALRALAAETQERLERRLSELIGGTWRTRPIGSQIRMEELWNAVRETPNVRRVLQILAEGACDREGVPQLAPLERDGDFPYAVVENGTHRIRVR